MKRLAAFVLSGYGRAILCVVGFQWLALFIPVTGILSNAALALTALKWGPQRPFIVLTLSALGLFVLLQASAVIGLPVSTHKSLLLFILAQWLPVVLFGWLLYATRSLSFTLNVIAVVSMVAVVMVRWVVPGSVEMWDQLFNSMFNGAVRERELNDAEFSASYQDFLEIMTGIAVTSLILIWVVSLLLARWWQGLLAREGAFRSEFTALKLGKVAAVVSIVLFATLLFGERHLIRELLLVMMSAFLFQGIATVHGVLAMRNAKGWLLAFYVLLALSPVIPQVPGFLSMLGALDNFIDLRARVRSKPKRGEE